MSAAKETPKDTAKAEYRITGGMWANAWKIAAAVGVLGLAASAFGAMGDVHRFAYSYLFAFIFCFTLCAGALFFVLVQRMTSANWSVTVRRTAEFFMAGMPAIVVLFVPILFVMGNLYPWLNPSHAEHEAPAVVAAGHEAAGEHATDSERASADEHAGAGAGATHAEAVNEDEQIEHEDQGRLLQEKHGYLNPTFFGIRLILYFLILLAVALNQFRWSVAEDTTKDPKYTVLAQRWAPLSVVACGLTVTFAGFDWVMSLYPYWYSTIFGVWFFAGGFVTIHAVITLVTLSLRSSGFTGEAINREHFHDLGKLTFGFNVFWAYISFAQFFLIWYAAIPEETIFYHFRWGTGDWRWVSLGIILVHFVAPFFILLSRNVKRHVGIGLVFGCVLLVLMHVVEMYWAIIPNYVPRAGLEPGDVLQIHWLDFTCLLGVGGIYLAWVFRLMTRNSLIPVGDPRLARSLAFENA